jgi:glutathione S-transferase
VVADWLRAADAVQSTVAQLSHQLRRFLDDRAGGRLYPPAPRLWETLTLEATGDGILDAAILMVYEWRVRPEDKRHEPWVEGQWAKVARALDTIEARWMSHLNGPLDIGQIAVGCALGYLDFRHDARGWRNGRPALAAWEKAFAARPSMAATVPPAA